MSDRCCPSFPAHYPLRESGGKRSLSSQILLYRPNDIRRCVSRDPEGCGNGRA
jgi:hypothetical protein